MTLCLCGLLVATLSAGAADMETTRQFTAEGSGELNPITRPFVEGRGPRGEALMTTLTSSMYLMLDQTPEPGRSIGLGLAFALHSAMAVRNVRMGVAQEVPDIVFPVLMAAPCGWSFLSSLACAVSAQAECKSGNST
jgi:hypothetical protein